MCFLESQGCIPLVSVCFLRLNAWMRQEEFTPELSPPFSTEAPDLMGLVPPSLIVSLPGFLKKDEPKRIYLSFMRLSLFHQN